MGERSKREVKSANLPNTFDYDCSLLEDTDYLEMVGIVCLIGLMNLKTLVIKEYCGT